MTDRSTWTCSENEAKVGTVKHCRNLKTGIDNFQIVPKLGAEHVAAFVRINGPIIDTILFQQGSRSPDNRSVWQANSSSCKAGDYTAAVHIYLQDAHPEAVLRNASCFDPLFDAPFAFAWTEAAAASPCTSVWHWADRRNADDLSRYRNETRPDYAAAYAGLRSAVPAFDFAANGGARRRGLVCVFGDSQMRNLVNSIGGLVDPANCDPDAAQLLKRNCQVRLGPEAPGRTRVCV